MLCIRWRAVRAGTGALLVALLAGSMACGKKGPPLAPIIRVPAAAGDFTARRIGNTVHLQLTVPAVNTDGSRPANIGSVTIYGFTGTPLSNEDFIKRGTIVARFPVRNPPPPLPEGAAAPPLPATGPGLDQGALASAAEELTPEVKAPILPKTRRRETEVPPEPSSTVIAPPLAGPPAAVPVARMYAAVGTSRGGQRGPLSPRISVPLVDAPSPPPPPTITYTATAINITWTPPPDARQHIQVPTPFPPPAPAMPSGTYASVITAAALKPPAAPPPATAPASTPPAAPSASAPIAVAAAEPAPPSAPVPSRPLSLASAASAYNVYEVGPPEETNSAVPPSTTSGQTQQPATPLTKPLNPAPLAAPAFQDARVAFGTRRCYVVRTVNTYATLVAESEASPPQCVALVDTFPPAAPKSLSAVASPGTMNLIWDANSEPDLAGYIVLRAEAPNETLQPLFEAPIRDTSFQDKTVKPGALYTYAVIALDNATPPNPSPQSNRVTEAAR